jgi:hypothetical protein
VVVVRVRLLVTLGACRFLDGLVIVFVKHARRIVRCFGVSFVKGY